MNILFNKITIIVITELSSLKIKFYLTQFSIKLFHINKKKNLCENLNLLFFKKFKLTQKKKIYWRNKFFTDPKKIFSFQIAKKNFLGVKKNLS